MVKDFNNQKNITESLRKISKKYTGDVKTMKVIGVTGLPGSGKSVVSRIAKKLDIPIVRMGDVIREEAKKRNQETGECSSST